MEKTDTHIVIVEDQLDVRASLCDLLLLSGRFAGVTAYEHAEEPLAVKNLPASALYILDIGLPGMDGVECLVRLKARDPGAKVLMFTVMEHDDKVFSALKAGADGYLLKRETPEKILAAIDDALQGGAPMSSEIARRVLLSFREKPATPEGSPLLSEREIEVLEKLSRGFLYKEIAAQLGISLNTVKQHIHHIYEKMQVQNRTEAVLRYLGK